MPPAYNMEVAYPGVTQMLYEWIPLNAPFPKHVSPLIFVKEQIIFLLEVLEMI